MNATDIFIDTNILFYAHDCDAGDKHLKASQLISEIWTDRKVPTISVQVLQELLASGNG
jgi:predicted nucleic acid-binding protein